MMIRQDVVVSNYRTNTRFWDNWRNNLEDVLKNFETQSEEVLAESEDRQCIERMHTLLQNALDSCRERYREILVARGAKTLSELLEAQ